MRYQAALNPDTVKLVKMARPERFELPTTKFVAWCSIQLSYGRAEEGKYERKQTGRQRLMAIKSDSVKP